MTDDEAWFVDALAHHLYSRGMPPMAARMWSWLTICEPPEQTAAQLAEELHASRGAISSAARHLADARLIRRSRRRGDRSDYFSAPPAMIRTLLANVEALLRQGRQIADEGLALFADRSAESRARLQEIRDVYAFYEREWPSVTKRYFESPAPAQTAGQAPERADAIPA